MRPHPSPPSFSQSRTKPGEVEGHDPVERGHEFEDGLLQGGSVQGGHDVPGGGEEALAKVGGAPGGAQVGKGGGGALRPDGGGEGLGRGGEERRLRRMKGSGVAVVLFCECRPQLPHRTPFFLLPLSGAHRATPGRRGRRGDRGGGACVWEEGACREREGKSAAGPACGCQAGGGACEPDGEGVHRTSPTAPAAMDAGGHPAIAWGMLKCKSTATTHHAAGGRPAAAPPPPTHTPAPGWQRQPTPPPGGAGGTPAGSWRRRLTAWGSQPHRRQQAG